MNLLDRAEIRDAVEKARAFSGWTFENLDVRTLGGPLPWNYEAMARDLASRAECTIDLGTGGGEVYQCIVAKRRGRSVASEEWGVNARVAAERLGADGVSVVRASSERTPWRSGTFNLVLSRHEAVEPAEVDRILRPGGTFLTQQVCPEHWPELMRFLPRATVFSDHWQGYQGLFREHGYTVEAQRHDYQVLFGSLADVVFMLMVSPWEVPQFDVEADGNALLALERELSSGEGIVLSEGRYVLEAQKAAVS